MADAAQHGRTALPPCSTRDSVLRMEYPLYAMRMLDFLALETLRPHNGLVEEGLVVPLDLDGELSRAEQRQEKLWEHMTEAPGALPCSCCRAAACYARGCPRPPGATRDGPYPHGCSWLPGMPEVNRGSPCKRPML